MNELISEFSSWIGNSAGSQALIGSFYLWNWIESAHVLTLMVSLGMLFIIDLRMLGWTMTKIPADVIAEKLNIPMLVGFAIMIITGSLLYYANAIHETHSIWFRFKFVLLIAAAINAFLFHRAMNKSVSSWANDVLPPKRIRTGAAISLCLWVAIVFMGRLMAYNWFDCELPQGDFISAIAGCSSFPGIRL